MGEGILATGQIDLAYLKAREWTVIDFKTAGISDRTEALAQHGTQLAVYREAVAMIAGTPVRSALCLLSSGQLIDPEGSR